MHPPSRITTLWRIWLTSRDLTIRADGQYRHGHGYVHAARCKQVDDEYFRHLNAQAASSSVWVSWREILNMPY